MVRFKNRYLVLEIIPIQPLRQLEGFKITSDEITKAIFKKVQHLHGDFGNAVTRNGFLAKYCNPQLRIALIRVRHGPHKIVASTLPFINLIGDKNVLVHSLYTGGSMRSCFKFLTKYQQQRIYQDLEKLKGKPEYNKIREEFMNLSILS